MADTQITLGSFVFRDMEIPESINFGGQQRVTVHDLVGGARIVDSMGATDNDITWGGLIMGPDAMARAQQLDLLRIKGLPLAFTLFNLNYTVLVSEFVFNPQRYYQIAYTITLKVVIDLYINNVNKSYVSFNDAINIDLSNANSIAAALNFPALTNSLDSLTTTVDNTNVDDQSTPVNDVITGANNLVQPVVQSISTGISGALTSVENWIQDKEASLGF